MKKDIDATVQDKREYGLDLLRICCTLMVILLHQGMNYVTEEAKALSINYFFVGSLYHSFTKTAVPCFVMLSGAFLLSNTNINLKQFYIKMLRKLACPTIVYGLLYTVLKMAVNFVRGMTNDQVIYEFINGLPYYHLWYMFMIIDLYLLTPILLKLKAKYKCLFIVFGVVGIVIDVLRILPRQTYFWIFWGFSYLGYFIFGNVLYNIACKARNGQHRLCLSLIVISSVLMLLYTANIITSHTYLHIWNSDSVDINNIIEYIASFILFFAFSLLEVKKKWLKNVIRFLSPLCSNVYFVHAGILTVINPLAERFIFKDPLPDPVYYIPIMFVVYVGMSFRYSYAIKKFIGKRLIFSRG